MKMMSAQVELLQNNIGAALRERAGEHDCPNHIKLSDVQ